MSEDILNRVADTYDKDGVFVSTCKVLDNDYETGISHPSISGGRTIVIAETYGSDRDAAKLGHTKWIEGLTQNKLPSWVIKEMIDQCIPVKGYEFEINRALAAGAWVDGEPGSKDEGEIWLFRYDDIIRIAWWHIYGGHWTAGGTNSMGYVTQIQRPDAHAQINIPNQEKGE